MPASVPDDWLKITCGIGIGPNGVAPSCIVSVDVERAIEAALQEAQETYDKVTDALEGLLEYQGSFDAWAWDHYAHGGGYGP